MASKDYAVYIMTNNSGALYIGVTNDLANRVEQHKSGNGSRFTSRYRLTRLDYYEYIDELDTARTRERQLKGWLRRRKVALIFSINPTWRDLSETLAA
ncbi:MAG TPA: GIY-YIG nuclease family protein [Dehalococcoidia bacterium]|nr:GIY-YIG nuclease family protein [Dehalococcoidia bacterium]